MAGCIVMRAYFPGLVAVNISKTDTEDEKIAVLKPVMVTESMHTPSAHEDE